MESPSIQPPSLHGPSEKERKYDRQLRLWAASGQAALEDARVLLLNSGGGTVGVEALKNLVLPGIGHFSIYDEATVTEVDLGTNFFLDEKSLGRSRAECCTNFLLELNPEVRGNWYPKTEDQDAQLAPGALETKRVRLSNSPSGCLGLQNLLQSLPAFTIVLYALPINPEYQDIIEAYGKKHKIPILSVHSAGFYAYFNIHLPGPFLIIETHPDPATTTDLRLLSPWAALVDFADNITKDLESQDHHTHGHVPFVAVLLHYLQKWKDNHEGSYPLTFSQKNEFRKMVTAAMRTDNPEGGEENFEEAVAAVMRNLTKPSLPPNLKEIFDLLDSSKAKAKADFEEVLAILRTSLDGKCVTEEDIALFCKNAAFAKLIKPQTVSPEHLKEILEKEAANDEMSKDTGAPLSLLPIYLALKTTSYVATSSAKGIMSSINEITPNIKNRERFQAIAEEVARAGGSELHNISAAVGGMIAQEMIKVITRQYIPINNTCIFDGITSRCQVINI
ncbi:Nedd8-activating enzyme E1 regulatory subunit [Ceratocystis lukuohia]|uniref:NEDD8-activating enzyme E1 regulatory subunit n=1 Tax=Ceratocystis lukuohia TaxID=2019550 RepID=A0ABR4MBL8_9PEZI